MNEVILAASIILTLILIVTSRSLLAPICVFCILSSGNALVFYVVSFLEFYPERVSSWWQVKSNYQDVSLFVFLFYLILVIIAAISQVISHYNFQKEKQKISLQFDPNKKINLESVLSVERLLSSSLVSLPMLVVLLCILLLIWVHCLKVDFSKIIYYNEYLSIRTNPELIGIKDGILKIIHTNLPIVGCLMSAMSVLYLRLHNPLFFVLAAIPSVYSFLFSIAFNSRFASLQLLMTAYALHLSRKKSVSIGSLLFLFIGYIIYAATLQLRALKGVGRFGDFGIFPFLELLTSGSFKPIDYFVFALFNFFGGGFVMAEAFDRGSFSYPVKYKLLSLLSPFPSILDGFNAVEYVKRENRAALYSPFSNFAEVYFFGFGYWVYFTVFLILALFLMTKVWNKYRGQYTFILFLPAYYVFIRMHTYPLRNTMRFLFMALILMYFSIVIAPSISKRKSLTSLEIDDEIDLEK